jgi:hypothetical protein
MYYKELLGFNFWHQKLRAKNTWLLVSNFWRWKLESKNIYVSISNFWCKKLRTESPMLWAFQHLLEPIVDCGVTARVVSFEYIVSFS